MTINRTIRSMVFRQCFLLLFLGVTFCLFSFSRKIAAEEWAQFRGANATGVSTESKNLPVKFSFEENVLWSVELGEGVASPIISKSRLIATAMVDKEKFAVFCFDAVTGKNIWSREFETGKIGDIIPPNVPASSTPVSDGKRVYVHFSTLGLMAFNLSDGKTVWTKEIPEPFYLMGWGSAQSPIIYKDMLIYSQDDDLSPFIMAVDKLTGKLRWKTDRPDMLAGYSTPVLCTANGRTDLVLAGTGKWKGYDPQTGKERWTCNTLLRTIMTTPVVAGDKMYLSVQSYGDTARVLKFALLQWKDTNQDGKLDMTELDPAFAKKFKKGDKDKDGFLVDDEIDAAFQAPGNMVGGGNIIQCIRGGGTGDVTKTHLVWNLDNKAPSNISSPVIADGRLFLVKKGGISASFDAQTGETIWMRKRIRNFGNYYASPVVGDGKIYVTGENGFIIVVKQGPKLEVLEKNDMQESCIATPAIANGRLYIRTLNKLYCISKEAK
jgi:outer membrane protein assembly factor BamB